MNDSPYYDGYQPNDDEPRLRIVDADEQPDDLPEQPEPDTGALARRILIAFIVIAAVWFVFVTLLAHYIPVILPTAMSVVIMLGALLASPDAPRPRRKPEPDDARPVGCCQGPRPLGEASRKASDRCDPGCGCG